MKENMKNTKKKSKKSKKPEDITARRVKNFGTTLIMEAFVVIFVLLIGYLAYFSIYRAPSIIDNSYNKRIDALSDKVIRGQITDKNGNVLATTITDDSGNEKRFYPYGNVFSHVVGINCHGKSGLESLCNYSLLNASTNFIDELVRDLSGEKLKGNNVITTLDANLQKSVYDTIGLNTGSAIVMEADTGKILAMVSKPDFDPNEAEEKYDEWAAYNSSDSVLLNRAIHGVYPPGSTFKMIMLLEYLRENSYDSQFEYTCNGVNTVNNYTLSCYDKRVHGRQNLMEAFANSCNGAFATIGCSQDILRLQALCSKCLFNLDYEFELGHNKSSFTLDKDAQSDEIIATSIGQGKTSITPLHNLILIAAAANKGQAPVPYVVEQIVDADGNVVSSHETKYYERFFSESEAEILESCLEAVVTIGTADPLKNAAYPIYGKTGSAQFDNSSSHHSLFMGYALIGGKKIAISVVIEGGKDHFAVASAVARQIFDSYYSLYGGK